jgi:hypothetical protein
VTDTDSAAQGDTWTFATSDALAAALPVVAAAVARRDTAIQAALVQMKREREVYKEGGASFIVYGYDKCIELVEAAIHSSTI